MIEAPQEVTQEVTQNRFSFSTVYHYRYSDEIFTGSDRVNNAPGISTTFQRISLTGSYRVNNHLILSSTIPFTYAVRKERGLPDREIQGLSDASISATWIPWTDEDSSLRHLYLNTGLMLPTGESENNPRSGITNPTVFQLGTGTFQGILGTGYNRTIDGWNLGASASYLFPLNESSNEFRPAPSFYTSMDVSRSVYHRLRAGLGISYSQSGRDRFQDMAFDDTGSTTVALTPALVWIPRENIAVSASVAIPIYRDVNETALAAGSLWKLGLRWKF